MNEFLDAFFKREQRDEPSKHCIRADRFDLDDVRQIQKEMREFEVAQERLSEDVDTGTHAFEDMFFALMKSDPWLKDRSEIQGKYRVNRAVESEAMELKEYEELRLFSTNDIVATGLACVAMEPDLRILFDKLKKQQEEAQQLQQMQQAYGEMQSELDELTGGDPDNPPPDIDPENYQEQVEQIQQNMAQLAQQIQQASDDLDASLEQAGPEMRAALKSALDRGIDQAETLDTASQMWGLEPGSIQRLPADQRIALAQKMNSERLRKLAKLFGAMHRMAFAERSKRSIHSRDEIYDIELGSDLSRVLPTELLALHDETLELDFMRRYLEGGLLQYRLRGVEKLARGGIITCLDSSGSMAGDKEIWSKAVALVLMQIARSQKRPFHASLFSSPGKLKSFDFRDTSKIQPEAVIEFAETFLSGGTDFVTPLSAALDIAREDHAKDGSTKFDIVLITDGICGVPDEWLKEYLSESDRIGIRTYGIIVGGSPSSEPINSICSGKVISLTKLTSGDEIRDVFSAM